MATVLVKNLPNVSTTDDDDLLIVNIGGGTEYTTSNIKVADLRTALNSSSNNFASDVEVNGNVTITQEATDGGKTFVGNLVGNVTGSATTVESLSPHTTDKLPEGSANKYFNTANFNAAVQVTQVGNLADVTISGGGTASNGEFLLHNGTAFVNTPVSAYDQSAEVTALRSELGTYTGQATVVDEIVTIETSLYDLRQEVGFYNGGATIVGEIDNHALRIEQLETSVGNYTGGATIVAEVTSNATRITALETSTTASDAATAASNAQTAADTAQTAADTAQTTADATAALVAAAAGVTKVKENYVAGELDTEAKLIVAINNLGVRLNEVIDALS